MTPPNTASTQPMHCNSLSHHNSSVLFDWPFAETEKVIAHVVSVTWDIISSPSLL